jgi:hypothetical protein
MKTQNTTPKIFTSNNDREVIKNFQNKYTQVEVYNNLKLLDRNDLSTTEIDNLDAFLLEALATERSYYFIDECIVEDNGDDIQRWEDGHFQKTGINELLEFIEMTLKCNFTGFGWCVGSCALLEGLDNFLTRQHITLEIDYHDYEIKKEHRSGNS